MLRNRQAFRFAWPRSCRAHSVLSFTREEWEEPEKRGLLEQIWWDAAALSGKEERLCW